MLRLVAVVAMIALAGCTASSSQVEQDTAIDRTILPASSYAVRVELDDGKRFEWSWSSDGPLQFQVADNDGTVLLSRGSSRADSGMFTATQDGIYSLQWRNLGSDPVDVRYSLRAYGHILD
jgi:hypothetical protein